MQHCVLKYKKTVANKICKNCFIKQYCYVLAIGTKKRKIGNNTTNQQRLFGKTQKKSTEKIEKDSRKFTDNKTSLQATRACGDLERIAIDKKQNIEKIHKEPGQSNRQLSKGTRSIKSPVEQYHSNLYRGNRSIKSSVEQYNSNR